MIAPVILAFLTGAALGVIFMGMVAAGRRENDCLACRRAAEEEWRDGTD